MRLEAPSTLAQSTLDKTEHANAFWMKRSRELENFRHQAEAVSTGNMLEGDAAKGVQQVKKVASPVVTTTAIVAGAIETHIAKASFERYVKSNYEAIANAGASHGFYVSEGGISKNFVEGSSGNMFEANLDVSKLQNPEMYGIKNAFTVKKPGLQAGSLKEESFQVTNSVHVSKLQLQNMNTQVYTKMANGIMRSNMKNSPVSYVGARQLSHFAVMRGMQTTGIRLSSKYSADEKMAIIAGNKAKRLSNAQYRQKVRIRRLQRRVPRRLFRRAVRDEDMMQGYRTLQMTGMVVKQGARFVTVVPGKAWKIPQRAVKLTLNKLNITQDDFLAGFKNKYARNIGRVLLDDDFGNGMIRKTFRHKAQEGMLTTAENVLGKLNGNNKLVMFGKDAVNLMKTDVTKAPYSVVKGETRRAIGKLARKGVLNNTVGGKWAKPTRLLSPKKIRDKAKQKFLTKFTRPVKTVLKNSAKMAAKAVMTTVKAAIRMLAYALAALGPIGLVIFAALFAILFVLMTVTSILPTVTNIGSSATAEAEADANGYNNIDVSKWVKHLNETHNKFCDEIVPSSFGVDEIKSTLYSNGSQENYKEVISAVAVMINYDWDYYKDKEVYELLDEVYYATHQVSATNFGSQTYTTGTGKNATTVTIYYCDVDVSVKRGMDVIDSCVAYTVNNGYVEGETTLNLTDSTWIKVCYAAKKAMATAAKERNCGYDQEKYIPIKVNNGKNEETYQVRTDCSGYVTFALQLYGALDKGEYISSKDITSKRKLYEGSSAKFELLKFTSYNDLQVGDIYGYPGHIQIYAGRKDGVHYRFNAGNTEDLWKTGYSKDSATRSNTYILRPKDKGENSTGASTVSTQKKKKENTSSAKSTASTEKDAISALLKTAKSAGAEKNDGGLDSVTNSWDFVQYVFSRHGATLGNTMTNAYQNLTVVSADDIQKGDIIIYGEGVKEYIDVLNDSVGDALAYMSGNGQERINEKKNVALIAESPSKAIGYINRSVGDLKATKSVDEVSINKSYVGVVLRPTDLTVETVDGATQSFGGWTDDTKELYAAFIFWDMDEGKYMDETYWIEESDTSNENYEDRYVGYEEGSFDGFTPDMSSSAISNIDYNGENKKHIYIYLREAGFTHAQACGIMGNLWVESRYEPTALSSSGYYGIAQWDKNGRAAKLKSGTWLPASERKNFDYTDLDTQLRYMVDYEIFQGHRTYVKEFLTNSESKTNVIYACEAFCVYFEGCTGSGQSTVQLKTSTATSHTWQMLTERRDMAAALYDDPSLEKAYNKYLKKKG